MVGSMITFYWVEYSHPIPAIELLTTFMALILDAGRLRSVLVFETHQQIGCCVLERGVRFDRYTLIAWCLEAKFEYLFLIWLTNFRLARFTRAKKLLCIGVTHCQNLVHWRDWRRIGITLSASHRGIIVTYAKLIYCYVFNEESIWDMTLPDYHQDGSHMQHAIYRYAV